MSDLDQLELLERTQAARAPVLIQASDGKELSSWIWTIVIIGVIICTGVALGLSIHNTFKLSQAPAMVESEIESAMLLVSGLIQANVSATAEAQSGALLSILDGIQTALADLDARVSALEGSKKRSLKTR